MSKISYFSFFISSSSLIFQLYILYPWHLHISKQLNRLENKIDNLIIIK
jgi:hypothetical protein